MHALRPLDHLLIHGICGVIHQYRALLVVELAIHAGVPDEVHDPFLALVLVEP